MNMLKIYHHIFPQTMHPLDMPKESYEAARHTWLCNGCCQPKPGYRALDATVVNNRPSAAALDFVMGCGIPVARKELLFSLGEDTVRRDLYLGRVFGPNQKPFEELVTFRGRYRLIVRGDKLVGNRICDQCRRQLYSAISGSYLYPEPPLGIGMFESHLCGLVISDDIFRRLDLKKWKETTHEELYVASAPKDGLLGLVPLEDRETAV